MATLVGIVAGGLLGTILTGAFSRQNQTYSETTNVVTQYIAEQMQRAVQATSQNVIITQAVNAPDAVIRCGGSLNIGNTATVNARAMSTFDVKSAATVSNMISNEIVSSITQSQQVKTAFGSSLPSGTNSVQMTRNLTQIVSQVYTSENLNSMLQIIQVNQTINLQGANIQVGQDCNIRNLSSAEILAENSLQVLSESLFTNKITNAFMTTLRQTYTGEAAGIFAPLSDFFSMIRWVAIAIVAVIGIVVLAGGILRLVAASKGVDPKAAGLTTEQLLPISSFTS